MVVCDGAADASPAPSANHGHVFTADTLVETPQNVWIKCQEHALNRKKIAPHSVPKLGNVMVSGTGMHGKLPT